MSSDMISIKRASNAPSGPSSPRLQTHLSAIVAYALVPNVKLICTAQCSPVCAFFSVGGLARPNS